MTLLAGSEHPILVSVVIPTYRRSHLLAAALESVLEQTYRRFEVIIVNDCPDGRERVEQIATRAADARVRIIHHQANRGPSACRNTGVAAASGGVIAFLDDDDRWLPEKLSRHVSIHHARPDVGLVYSGCIRKWDGDILPPRVHQGRDPPADVRASMRQNRFCPEIPTVGTIRRDSYIDVGGFDEQLVQFEDWDLLYRLAQRWGFAAIREPLAIIRQHLGTRSTTTFEQRRAGVHRLLEKWKDLDERRFLSYHVPFAVIASARNAALSGCRFEAAKKAFALATMKIDRGLMSREIPNLIILLLFGARAGRLALGLYLRICRK